MVETAPTPMVLVRFKGLTEVVVTNTEQVELAANVAPESATKPLPGAAVMMPLAQVVCALGVEKTWIPVGNVSVNVTLSALDGELIGLVMSICITEG